MALVAGEMALSHIAIRCRDERIMRYAVTVSVLLHAGISGWWLHRLSQRPPELPSRFEVVIQPAAQAPARRPRLRPTAVPERPKPPRPVARPAPPKAKRIRPKKAATKQPRPVMNEVESPSPPVQETAVTEPTVTAAAMPPEPEPLPAIPPRPSARFDNPRPWYPRMARRRGMEGRVTLRVTVSPDGHVAAIRVAHSSGYRLLDDAALETVKTWRFVPAYRGDTPVTGEVLVPIRFRLRSGTVEMADAGEPR